MGMIPVSVQLSKSLTCYSNLSHLIPSNEQTRMWVVVCMYSSGVSLEIHQQLYSIVFPSFSLYRISVLSSSLGHSFHFFSQNAGALGNLLGHILLLYLFWVRHWKDRKRKQKGNEELPIEEEGSHPSVVFHCRLLLQSLLGLWHERTE